MSDAHIPAVIFGGIPAHNAALYHQIRFQAGDPAALVVLGDNGSRRRRLIIRDIEMDRARANARADDVSSPADFTPEGGLSADRETATAQAAAELLRREGVGRVVSDRTLPLSYAHEIEAAGIELVYDPDLGVRDRRAKDAQELVWLREAQGVTEQCVRMACETIAGAEAGAGGVLNMDAEPLTAERVRAMIDVWLLERGYLNELCIVAGGTQGGDCHERGSGPLRTGEPVIIDIFPRNRVSLYNGDCTRTVVHGEAPDDFVRMHAAVVEAKRDAIAATRAGVTGEDVHRATVAALARHGYRFARPAEVTSEDEAAMVHGTGHGVGLEVHEPPLLDIGGPPLVAGDVLTVEPGLYRRSLGGVRVEDMVAVTRGGADNFNSLPDGLDWA